jgi:NAD(P)H dehydrogenase (quinone)
VQHLAIVTHPRRKSFTQTVAKVYAAELAELGHDIVVRDLYRRRFDPLLGEAELLDSDRPKTPAMVRREQHYLAAAGAVAFFYPLWWAFMPAMMKGYLDRVLAPGFAYDLKDDDLVPRLSGKRALIFTSSGADLDYLRDSGQWQAMRLLEREHTLSLCGIELLDHVHFPSITPDLPARTLEKHLDRVRRTVQKYWGGAPAARG